ncbi:MAG TPA: TetR/AcrR family transcriptional regulator [Steroidobacteraceae bacterium]|jgi:TetR/AcrR family transcriptional regulator|nr:TetR/AcrR family transcriptional regulator [Steroidobacteraceae bacterium]
MNDLAERRTEEKERRRTEILDAAEAVAASEGWDDMTMDQVARRARLSRALLYVYFTDKTDLLFGVGDRAMSILTQRCSEAAARHRRGITQLEAISRAYVEFSQEFPVYFGVLARCELRSSTAANPDSNEGECARKGDALQSMFVGTLENGMRDGSIRADAGQPAAVAIVLWGFLHGVIQLSASKANLVGRRGVSIRSLLDQGLILASRSVSATA